MDLPLLSIFGDLERFVSEDLYPYRVPVTIGAIVALIAAAYAAERAGLLAYLWQRRVVTTAVGVPAIVILGYLVFPYVSPLWERSRLDEAPPVVEAATVEGGSETPQASAGEGKPAGDAPLPTVVPSSVVLAGEFQGADDFHFGRGQALIIETAPGEYVLRFEDFSVRNGPDLFVYVSPDPDGYAEGALILGELKATDGAFNYEIPDGTDLAQLKSAIVWCRQFSVLFAVAPLAPPR